MNQSLEKTALAASVILAMTAQAQAGGYFVDYQSHNFNKLSETGADAFGYTKSSDSNQKLYAADNSLFKSIDPLTSDLIGQTQNVAGMIAADMTSQQFQPVQMQASLEKLFDYSESDSSNTQVVDYPVDTAALIGQSDRVDLVAMNYQADEESDEDSVAGDSDLIDATEVYSDSADSNQETPRQSAMMVEPVSSVDITTQGDFIDVTTNYEDQADSALIAESQADETDLALRELTPPIDDSADTQAESVTAQSEQVTPVAVDPELTSPSASVTSSSIAAPAVPVVAPSTPVVAETQSLVPEPVSADTALAAQEDDATAQSNLEEVLTSSEKRYSLVKQGDWALNYDANYTYYRDSQIDIATEEGSSNISRFRIFEDAQHTLINSFDVQYGLRDNLTVSADLPIVAKTDLVKDAQTVGLGDISLGARWEPFPLERDRLPLIFNGNVSLKTGDSPYEINSATELSTGKGYYSVGGGVSTRKYVDPVVLFASGSLNYGFEQNDISQPLGGSRTLVGVKPNLGAGLAVGFAYSLNYDVSLTMSYQQSFAVGSEFTVQERDETSGQVVERTSSSADQTSAIMNFALGVRVSPKTIVNTSVGFGLTEDSPDVSVGLSFPLNFNGFGRKAS